MQQQTSRDSEQENTYALRDMSTVRKIIPWQTS